MTQSSPATKLRYLPAFDGLRALAVLAVLACHTGLRPFTNGRLGVDFFFVLSGFLITSLLVQEWESTNRISFANFYVRRALRLLPAVMFLCVIFAVLVDWRAATITLLYGSNWARAFELYRLGALDHTWSLAIEEQFYLVWPLLFWLLLRSGVGRRALILLVFLGALLAMVLRLRLAAMGATDARIYNGLDTRADALLIGCATGFMFSWKRLPHKSRVGTLAVRALAIIAATFYAVCLIARDLITEHFFFRTGSTLLALAASCMIVSILVEPSSLVARALETRWLVWIGRRSYGLYLWHYPIVYYCATQNETLREYGIRPGVTLGASLVLSFVAAGISYRWIEEPFLKMKGRFGVTSSGVDQGSSR